MRCMREIDEAVSAAPFWDAVILTASSEHQAEGFRLQIESRRAFLPKGTQFFVIPDEGGMRVGSGGATLSALKLLKENGTTGQNLHTTSTLHRKNLELVGIIIHRKLLTSV